MLKAHNLTLLTQPQWGGVEGDTGKKEGRFSNYCKLRKADRMHWLGRFLGVHGLVSRDRLAARRPGHGRGTISSLSVDADSFSMREEEGEGEGGDVCVPK